MTDYEKGYLEALVDVELKTQPIWFYDDTKEDEFNDMLYELERSIRDGPPQLPRL